MKYIALLVIWVLFWIAGIFAPLASVLRAAFTRSSSPVSDTLHAQNRVAATVLGFDGTATISKECGRRLLNGKNCFWCRRLCALLSKLLRDDPHCEKEAGK